MPSSTVVANDSPRRCFICLMDEADDPTTPPSAWVDPCPCTLTAHQACMLTWIDSRGRESPSGTVKPLACPVCRAPIVVDRPWDPVVALLGAARRTVSLAVPWVLGTAVFGAVTASNFAHGAASLWLLAGREATARALWRHFPPRGSQDWMPGGWWLLSTTGPLIVTVQMFPALGTTVLPLWGSLTLSIRDFIHPSAKHYRWPPSPHTALVLLAYLRTTYWCFYRDYVRQWEHQLDRRALGLPPIAEHEGNGNGNNNGRPGEDNDRRQGRQEGGGLRAPLWLRILQGFLEGLDEGIRVAEHQPPAQGEANAGDVVAGGNAVAGGAGGGDDVVHVGFAVQVDLGDDGDDGDDDDDDDDDDDGGGGGGGGGRNVNRAERHEGGAVNPGEPVQVVRANNAAGGPRPAQAAAAAAPAPAAQPARDFIIDQNMAARANLSPLSRALSSLVRRLTCAFLLPAFCFGAGELLRLALPRSWTTPPRPGSGAQVRGLLQEQWGRSLVGGCAFIVLRDALTLWGKYRLVQTMDSRIVRQVDRKQRRRS